MATASVGGIKLVEYNKIEARIWRMDCWPEILFNVGDKVTARVEIDGTKYQYETITFRIRDREFKEYNNVYGLTLYIDVIDN